MRFLLFLFLFTVSTASSKRPQEVMIVSTLDGVLRGLDVRDGATLWTLTNPPLISQSLSDLEFLKDGKKFRLIPSLDGQLYMLEEGNGRNGLHALPITADALFTSSFQLSSESMLVGGKEQHVLGFNPLNGEIKYKCGKDGCQQDSTFRTDGVSCDLLLCRRISHIVRAIDIDSGKEIWNFSVGQDDVIPANMTSSFPRSPVAGSSVQDRIVRHEGCFMYPEDETDEGVTAWSFEVEDGAIQANSKAPFNRVRWRKELGASLSRVWHFRGRSLRPMSIFARDAHSHLEHSADEYGCPIRRSIFLGSFNGHMYIQLEDGSGRRSPRPVYVALPSTELSNAEDVSSVNVRHRVSKLTRYSDPYVVHQGFLKPTSLQEEFDRNKKWFSFQDGDDCYPYSTDPLVVRSSSFLFQKVTFAFLLIVVGHLIFKKIYLPYQMNKLTQPTETLVFDKNNNSGDVPSHVSRYETDYEHIRCLGRGAFGVVFEAKHKVDQYHYAVKRVRVRYSPRARDRLLQEVQAFAHLEHPGIVRYYQAWFELPPNGWQEQRDKELNLTKEDNKNDFSDLEVTESTGVALKKAESTASLTCGDSDDTGWSNVSVDNGSRDGDSLIIFDRSMELVSIHPSENNSACMSCGTPAEQTSTFPKFSSQTSSYIHNNCPCHIYLFISMHLYSGTTLQHRLQQDLQTNIRPPKHLLLNIFAQIVDAVSYLHSNGLMHRDLKPSNILFDHQDHIRIVDFGLATPLFKTTSNFSDNNGKQHQKGMLHTSNVGTELYMSPEQQKGSQYDQKVDIFALGIIFLELMIPLSTAMERVDVLSKARELSFEHDLRTNYQEEISFVSNLLHHNPKKRPSCEEILTHQILADIHIKLPRSRTSSLEV